jgi:hypothetical protein
MLAYLGVLEAYNFSAIDGDMALPRLYTGIGDTFFSCGGTRSVGLAINSSCVVGCPCYRLTVSSELMS